MPHSPSYPSWTCRKVDASEGGELWGKSGEKYGSSGGAGLRKLGEFWSRLPMKAPRVGATCGCSKEGPDSNSTPGAS